MPYNAIFCFILTSNLDLDLRCLRKTLTSKDLPPFENTGETLERIVVTEPVKLGFDLHQQVIEEYFRLKAENKI